MKETGPKPIPKKIIQEAERLGGADLVYDQNDLLPSYDKGCHKERSIANQPNHLKHWNRKTQNNDR